MIRIKLGFYNFSKEEFYLLNSQKTYVMDELLKIINLEILRPRKKRETRERWKNSIMQLMIEGKKFIDQFKNDPLYLEYSHRDFLLYCIDNKSDSSTSKFNYESYKKTSGDVELTYFDSLIFVTLIHCNKRHSQLYKHLAQSFDEELPTNKDKFLHDKNIWMKKVEAFLQSSDFKKYLDSNNKNNKAIISTIQNIFYVFATPELLSEREKHFENISQTKKILDRLAQRIDKWKETLDAYEKRDEKTFLLGRKNLNYEEWLDSANFIAYVKDNYYTNTIDSFINEFEEDMNDFK